MPYPLLDTTNDLSPINSIKSVTPSDSTDLPNGVCRALILNGTGNIKFDTANGETITLTISSAWFGVTYIRAKRIYATGTTIASSSIFAAY
jgi:hypothetical protein